VWAEDRALSKIEAADVAVALAFDAVSEAEKVGAEVSGLLGDLDAAGRLLAEAKMAYSKGALDEADAKAQNAVLAAGPVQSQAEIVRYEALVGQVNSLNFAFVTSVLAALVFVVVLVRVWVWFKRAYAKKVLGMKPEVVHDA
jgi:hypothetical protein